MTNFTRALIAGTALISLAFSGCKNNSVEHSIGDNASKAEIITLMKDAMESAKSTSGEGSPKIWKYADDDTTVYLFGTVHLLKPELSWRTSKLSQALKEADTLVLEADVTSPEGAGAIQKLIAQYAAFPEGETLSGTLSNEEKEIVSEALKEQGIPIDAVNGMKPWMVGLQLGIIQIMKAGYDPQSGVEAVLLSDPNISSKKLSYLESAETQIKALGGAYIEEQIQSLMATISTLEIGNDYLETLINEWAEGDVEGIGVMMSNPAMYGSKSAYDTLLTKRNENWILPLKALLNEPGVKFVAVGAGHLAGPDSVVKMLNREGLKVATIN